LDVQSFDLGSSGTLLHRWKGFSGSDGPPSGLQLRVEDEFTFTATGDGEYGTGFYLCGAPTPSTENLELIGGDNTTGIVYLNGQPICDYNWDDNDANVVCMKLGFDYGRESDSDFGETYDNFSMTAVTCSGQESSIWDCDYSKYYLDRCGVSDGARVKCNDYEPTTIMDVLRMPAVIFPTVICCILVCFCCLICKYKHKQQRTAIATQDGYDASAYYDAPPQYSQDDYDASDYYDAPPQYC